MDEWRMAGVAEGLPLDDVLWRPPPDDLSLVPEPAGGDRRLIVGFHQIGRPLCAFVYSVWGCDYWAPAYLFSPSSMFFLSWFMSTSAASAASLSCCRVMCF